MARIRTIKPEFWTSEQVADCSTTARLLFVGLWNFCDDYGVHPDSAKRIKMQIFPADNLSLSEISALVDELVAVKLLGRFDHEGERYLVVTGWRHQKIDKPARKFPEPPDQLSFDKCSSNGRRMVGDDLPAEWSGEEGIGEERRGKERRGPGRGKIGASPQTPVLVLPPALDRPDVRQSITDFLAMRQEIKKPVKPTSLKGLVKRLEKFGPAKAVIALENSIAGQWQGVFDPDDSARGSPARSDPRGNLATRERMLKQLEDSERESGGSLEE